MFNFYHKIRPILNLLSFFWRQFPLNILLLFTLQAPDCHSVKGPKIWDSIDKNTKVKCQVCFSLKKKGY